MAKALLTFPKTAALCQSPYVLPALRLAEAEKPSGRSVMDAPRRFLSHERGAA